MNEVESRYIKVEFAFSHDDAPNEDPKSPSADIAHVAVYNRKVQRFQRTIFATGLAPSNYVSVDELRGMIAALKETLEALEYDVKATDG